MPRALKVFVAGIVTVSALALAVTTFLVPIDSRIALDSTPPVTKMSVLGGIALWVAVTMAASALPVQMPRGAKVSVSIAPIIAAMALGGPTVAGWVAAIGTTEVREVRGRVPWYGTLANHAGFVLPAIVGGLVAQAVVRIFATVATGSSLAILVDFVATVGGAIACFALNVTMTAIIVGLRSGVRPTTVLAGDARDFYRDLFAIAPLGWLMAQIYLVAWWAILLFSLPLYTTRVAYHRFVEMREMFTQTIGALAEAVDARDPYTSKHSRNVMTMAVDIGRVMRVSAASLEALEWGGLLHDVGKIGVKDAVLLKPDRLTRDERAEMNAHPTKGASIIAPVTKLAPVVPLIRHHHEWFNGSGYPDRLLGLRDPGAREDPRRSPTRSRR